MNINYEKKLQQNYRRILGSDEVGFGSIALDFLVTAVVLTDIERAAQITVSLKPTKKSQKKIGIKIDDSKKFDPDTQIPLLYEEIMQSKIIKAVSFGWVSVKEIEAIRNMRQVQILGFNRAIEPLLNQCDVVITGNVVPTINLQKKPLYPLVKADQRCISVAIASIVGKYTRDQYCREYAKKYPGYCWERNKGYRSPQHFKAMVEQGLTPYHRVHFIDCQRALKIRKGEDDC